MAMNNDDYQMAYLAGWREANQDKPHHSITLIGVGFLLGMLVTHFWRESYGEDKTQAVQVGHRIDSQDR